MQLSRPFSLLLGSILILAGCGSNTMEGVFVDSPVDGLSFNSATQSGTTNSAGTFSFQKNEMVTFTLGDTSLGSAVGQSTLSPFDLIGMQPIVTARDIRKFSNDRHKGGVSSMEEVFNEAFFLQALDDDNDLTNGIKIPDQVPSLLSGVAVNFQMKVDEFTAQNGGNADLARLRRDGFAQGLWGGGRPLPNAGRAMDHLYATLGLTPEIFRATTFSFDQDNDGNADQIDLVSFDAEGRVSKRERDSDGDGIVDESETSFYDEFDHVVRVESDNNNDGTVDSVFISQFDSRGNRIHTEDDNNNDGTPERTANFFFNDLDLQDRSEFDNNADGVVDVISVREFNDQGNEILSMIDSDANGVFNSRATRQYDDQGNEIRLELDNDNNGTVDLVFTNQFDANNNLIRREEDINADGTPEAIETSEFDTNNNMIRHENDTNGDGTPEMISTREYDELGNVTRLSSDQDANGTIDEEITLQYDDNGNVTLSEFDNDGNGSVDATFSAGGYELGNWISFFVQED